MVDPVKFLHISCLLVRSRFLWISVLIFVELAFFFSHFTRHFQTSFCHTDEFFWKKTSTPPSWNDTPSWSLRSRWSLDGLVLLVSDTPFAHSSFFRLSTATSIASPIPLSYLRPLSIIPAESKLHDSVPGIVIVSIHRIDCKRVIRRSIVDWIRMQMSGIVGFPIPIPVPVPLPVPVPICVGCDSQYFWRPR